MSVAPPQRPGGMITQVQHLRALAVLLVVFAHLQTGAARFFDTPVIDQWALAGFAGVDIFFVLSGYIIHRIYRLSRGFDWRFIAGRANRIYPLYWIYSGLALAGYLLIGDSLTRGSDELDIWRSFTLWPQADVPVLVVGWTLTHELYFYLCYGIWLALPDRIRPWAAASWAVATLIIGGAQIIFTPESRVVFSLFNLQFLAGALIASHEDRLRPLRGFFLAALIVFGAASMFWVGRGGEAAITDMRVRSLVFAPFAIGAVGLLVTAPKAWAAPWLARIGDWSYSIYLSHILVIGVLARLTPRYLGDGLFAVTGYYLLALAACLICGALSYYALERPMLRMGKALLGKPRRQTGREA